MRILSPEEARKLRDRLEDSQWAESVGRVIAEQVAKGATIVINGRVIDGREVKQDDQKDGA